MTITEKEMQAKALIKQGMKPGEIAQKTGLSQIWIELQYLGGRRNG